MDKKLKAQKIISPLLIVLAALIWGISFVAQSEGGDVGSFTFQSIRCTLAFLSIGAVVLFQNNTKKAKLNKKKYLNKVTQPKMMDGELDYLFAKNLLVPNLELLN